MEPAVFKCTVDRRNRVITTIVIALMILIALLIGLTTPEDTGAWMAAIILPVIMALTTTIIYGNLPRRMVVTRDAILLKCPFHTKVIPRDANTEVRRIRDYDTQGLWRKWGSDGILGKWGLFASRLYPRLHFYAKRSKRDWILVKSTGKVYVLSPDDSEGFLKLFA